MSAKIQEYLKTTLLFESLWWREMLMMTDFSNQCQKNGIFSNIWPKYLAGMYQILKIF